MAKPAKESPAPTKATEPTHFEAIVQACSLLNDANPPYVFGGGHVTPAPKNGPFDCSSAVSHVLQAAGYNIPTMDSTGLMSWGEPGPGMVTIWASPSHVFLMFANKTWAWSCPSCKNGWQPLNNYGDPHHPNVDGPYVARHPPGLSGPAGQVSGSPSTSINAGEVTSGVDIKDVEAASKAAAFSAYLELPGTFDVAESLALKGQRSLMNDQSLLPFVEQLTKGSLRRFQSMPNGNFYAFYPDYFGGMNHRTPYWEIHDIEIREGQMNLTDEALATHVYVVGDNVGFFDGINVEDKAASAGVVTIFEAMAANFITGLDKTSKKQPSKKQAKREALNNKNEVLNFLQKYGARPFYEEAPMVRSNYYEMFLAYQRFCLLWSKQFTAEFELTYMPELFPGGLVALPEHGLQLFIEEVSHEFDYENGFFTKAVFSAPVALKGGPEGIHEGMIRANVLHPPK